MLKPFNFKKILLTFSCLSFFLLLTNYQKAAVEPTIYQKEFLEKQIFLRLSKAFEYWQKANFEELYNLYTDNSSKKRMTKLEFVSRMLQKKWLPTGKFDESSINQVKLVGLSRAFVVIKLDFKHQRNPNKTFSRTLTFNATYEENPNLSGWSFYALNFLQASF